MNSKSVIIIGGGFAGLSAAIHCQQLGWEVLLIEGRSHLGGRAYSFTDPTTGAVIDNGQHILMGCYHETLDFLEKIGTQDLVDFKPNLTVPFREPQDSRKYLFKAWPLPAPFHLLFAFLFFKGLNLKEKFQAIALANKIKKMTPEQVSRLDAVPLERWLTEQGQGKRLQERFWHAFNLAALNEHPSRSSTALFIRVVQEALLSGKAASRIGVPKTGLSSLYADSARDYIERKGGHILLKTKVKKIHFRSRQYQEVELEEGRRLSSDAVLVTVTPAALKKILPEELMYGDPFFLPLQHIQSTPIVSINVWTDQPLLTEAFVGCWKTHVHWIFNKGFDEYMKAYHYALVISGAHEWANVSGPKLSDTVIQEMRELYPLSLHGIEWRVLKALVTKELEATFCPHPNVEKLRLPQRTPYRHFYLAGDWTQTGLPGTIEGAVRSAKKAVELMQSDEY